MRKLAAFVLTFFAVSLSAQKATPIDVTVHQVNDRRTSGSFSQLAITLELPKIKSSEITASRVLVSAATDSSGRNLLDPQAAEPSLDPNFRGSMEAKNPPPPATVTVTLLNPDRKATSVKEVRGEIELYMPGKDPNSTAEVAKFMSSVGKPLTNKALKANAIEMAILNPAQIEAERKRIRDVKRKEAKESGWEDGADLDSMLESMYGSLLAVDENELLVRLKDPNQRIQEIVYVDAAGETKRVATRTDEGLTYFMTWGEKPQPDWKLRVSMKTAKNIVRHSFALKDVALP